LGWLQTPINQYKNMYILKLMFLSFHFDMLFLRGSVKFNYTNNCIMWALGNNSFSILFITDINFQWRYCILWNVVYFWKYNWDKVYSNSSRHIPLI
jgi:hypothetical protein